MKSVMIKQIFLAVLTVLAIYACQSNKKKEAMQTENKSPFAISSRPFGNLPGGQEVTEFTFANSNGMEVKIMDFGGIITSLKVPDRDGNIEDIVLGFDNLQGYLGEHPYFGALIGRYGNRIAKGKFTLEGNEYTLAVNNGENHLHGGLKGFDKVMWDAVIIENEAVVGLKLHYLSKDMEEGYPGNLDVEVVYTISDKNEIKVDYRATTDKTTVINLTQHSYFNLEGKGSENILDHEVMIKADNFIPVDPGLIPTGELVPVTGTPFDFSQLTKVGGHINDDNAQIKIGGGYDHCWVLNKSDENALDWVIKVLGPVKGRVMEMATTEPGVQFYSGNFLDGTLTGKDDVTYPHRYAFCLETEHYPDSPNQPQFPSSVLRPGEEYKSTTIFKFSILK